MIVPIRTGGKENIAVLSPRALALAKKGHSEYHLNSGETPILSILSMVGKRNNADFHQLFCIVQHLSVSSSESPLVSDYDHGAERERGLGVGRKKTMK